MLRYEICGATHQGRVRDHNEDHILVGRFVKNAGSMSLVLNADDDFIVNYGLLLCVADGIGGAAAGETASRIGLLTIEMEFYASMKTDAQAAAALLRQGVERANETLLDVAGNKAELAGMGTTFCGVCLSSEGYWTFNAGDSRVYRYRNGLLKLLTIDETAAAQAVRTGQMTLEQAADSPQSHILTNCLGKPDYTLTLTEGPELREDDMLLVCSDGLYDMIDDDALARLLRQMNSDGASCQAQVDSLISHANQAGGEDNISVILLRVSNERR